MAKYIMTGMLVALVAALAAPRAVAAEDGDAILGKWVSEDGKGRIDVVKKDDGKYCGSIIWLKEPVYPAGDKEAGKTKHDRENPDKALQDRPILGLQILSGLGYSGSGAWKGGLIYDPETGKTYKCKATLDDKGNKLDLRGFIGISLLGRTSVWTRLAEEPPVAAAEQK